MAARIVLLGYGGRCAEIDSPDAGALIASGMCRPSLTKWAGPLADATVLTFRPEYLAAHGGETDDQAHANAWTRALRLLGVGMREFEVRFPIEVGR